MANEDVKVKVGIEGDSKKIDKSLKNTQKELKKTEKITKKTFDKKNFLGAAGAILAIGTAVKSLIGAASKMEDIQVQFQVLTGNVNTARRVMQDLADFSAGTPFQFEDIAEAGKKLLGFGFAASELKDRLREIGDVSAALGTPLGDLALIFGQVRAAGKLTGERLLQFQERAVPIGAALAKTMGVPEKAIKKLVSEGKVSFDIFQEAFASLSEEGGVAFGGLEKKSQTLSGRISTLKDNMSLLFATIGKEGLPGVGFLVDKFTNLAKVIRHAIGPEAKLSGLKEELADITIQLADARKEMKDFPAALLATTKGGLKIIEKTNELAHQEYQLKLKIKALEDRMTADGAAEVAAVEQKIQAEEDYKTKLDQIKGDLLADATVTQMTELERLEAHLAEKKELEEIAKAEELAAKGDHVGALAALEDFQLQKTIKRLKDEEKAKKNQQKFEEKMSDMRVGLAAKTSGLITAILGQENKFAFLVQKAVAASQVLLGDAKARALVPAQTATIPYPGNLAAAAQMNSLISATTAVGLATIAAQTITGFNKGGVVEGGIQGMDSVLAALAPGELVVPQQNFDEVIDAVARDREGGSTEVTIGFRDDAFEIIEEKILERRALGTGVI